MESVFIANPSVNELIKFEDGTCFLTNQAGKCGANDYAKKTGFKSEIIKREVSEVKEEKQPKTNKK